MTPLQRRSCYLVVALDGCVHDRIHVLNRSGSGVALNRLIAPVREHGLSWAPC
jgi:hypothetical protein